MTGAQGVIDCITLGKMSGEATTVSVRLELGDLTLLQRLERFEHLRRSDVIRRALRAYAAQLGVSTPKRHRKR